MQQRDDDNNSNIELTASAATPEEADNVFALRQEITNELEDASNSNNATQQQEQRLTRYHIWVMFAVFLGWCLDAFDILLFTYAAPLCVPYLLGITTSSGSGGTTSQELITLWSGILSSLTLVGFTIGGIVFGFLTDKIGRSRVMMITMLLYGFFTVVCAASFHIFMLAILRFITALGLGGEYSSGANLVAESVPNKFRVAGGIAMSFGGHAGTLLAFVMYQITCVWLFNSPSAASYSWRVLFGTAIIPCFVAFIFRFLVHEPEKWQKAVAQKPTTVEEQQVENSVVQNLELKEEQQEQEQQQIQEEAEQQTQQQKQTSFINFVRTSPNKWPIIGSAIIVTLSLITWYCITAFLPSVALTMARNTVQQQPHAPEDEQAMIKQLMDKYILITSVAYNGGGFLGALLIVTLANKIGRVNLFRIFYAGGFVSILVTFAVPYMPDIIRLVMYAPLGVFTSGVLGMFTFYLPELFPTRFRGIGIGICYNGGRIITACFPLLFGFIILKQKVVSIDILTSTACVFPLIALVLSFTRLVKETKNVVI